MSVVTYQVLHIHTYTPIQNVYKMYTKCIKKYFSESVNIKFISKKCSLQTTLDIMFHKNTKFEGTFELVFEGKF